MKYMLLIYGKEYSPAEVSEEEQQAEMAQYFAINEHLRQRGSEYQGEALMPASTATTVRVRDDKTITTDGPFAETHEVLGGFYIVDAKDLDDAIAIAGMIPGARKGSIEIRPIVVF